MSISVEYDPNIEALYQRFEDGEELADAKIGALVRAGRMGRDDLDELAESSGEFSRRVCRTGKVNWLSNSYWIGDDCSS